MWFSSLFARWGSRAKRTQVGRRPPRAPRRKPVSPPLTVEVLEERIAPVSIAALGFFPGNVTGHAR
jgi:hypothetical protein